MVHLRVDEILKEQDKTAYWLAKQTGIAQNNILKICNGETSTIRFETIEKICKTLNCTPNDIIVFDDPQLQRLLAYQLNFSKLKNKNDTK